MKKIYEYNDKVKLLFDDDTASTLMTMLNDRKKEDYSKEKMREYYMQAASHMNEKFEVENIDALITRDYKEKGNEYVVAKMYLGCYLLNAGDFATYPGDWIYGILDETGEIWKRYGMKYTSIS